MTAPTVEHLAYRNPHAPRRGQPYTSLYTLADLEAMRGRFDRVHYHQSNAGIYWGSNRPAGHRLTADRPGWHGPLPTALHAEHEAREQAEAERRHAAHIAYLALKARRSANPTWVKVCDALGGMAECYGCGGSRPEDVDAVMDAVYGEGRW